MFLVDNFKIFLLVGLICAVGVPSADAQMIEGGDTCYKGVQPASQQCEKPDKSMCVVDKDGNPAGCSEDCKQTDWNYCCNKDRCNDMQGHKDDVCKASKNIKTCPGAVDPPGPDPKPTDKPNNNGTKSTASGLVPNYYGGIPVVAAVIPIFLVSLKSFS